MSTIEFLLLCGFPCLVFPGWCLWHLCRERGGGDPLHNESWVDGFSVRPAIDRPHSLSNNNNNHKERNVIL